MVALDRWSSYTVTIVWEFAWADSALVVLDEWSSYRGGRLNRFDCTWKPYRDYLFRLQKTCSYKMDEGREVCKVLEHLLRFYEEMYKFQKIFPANSRKV